MSGEPTEVIQWGALYRLPTGHEDTEVADSRAHAVCKVSNINHAVRDGAAQLVYRVLTYGPWQTGSSGDEWAVRVGWSDGHVEIRPQESRFDAEYVSGRYCSVGSTVEAVSRRVSYGQWWLAGAAVTS